ncbi:cell surface protein SprA, partial [bacterium]
VIGEGGVGLRVTGYRRITLSGRSDWYSGQELGYGQSKFPSLQMEQESRFTITGTIGSKISVTVDQDSKRETDLENTINISYTGEEDDIIQKIEAGNTNISLPGATFVGYSERVEGLFGIKSQFQIGDWSITAIASQEKGQHESTTITGQTSTTPTDKKDYNYLDLTYFWVDSSFIYPFPWPMRAGWSAIPEGDSIGDFVLFVDDGDNSNNIGLGAFEGEAMPTPGEPYDENIGHHGFFHEVSTQYYDVFRRFGWFMMTGYNQMFDSYAIACSYKYYHADGTVDTVGGMSITAENDTILYLNLIRPPDMDENNPCWEQTWRNVYSLGSQDLDPDNVEISIYLTPVTNDITSDTTQVPPTSFMQVFGIDKVNESGDNIPDGKVDIEYLNIGEGHLIFPVLHPFSPTDIEETILQFGDNTPRNEAMYSSNDASEINADHRYIIRTKTGQRQNPMNLGRFNIIEGSEVVKLGGRKLQNGVDYRIDYQIGQITFLKDEALNPNTTLTIDFDYEPFFMPEQKALLGARAEYRFAENSWLGGTALYKSVSSAERRPRIGREPSQAFIWDADLKLDYAVPIITQLVDAIPLIHTEQESRIVFTAEVAEVIGNPNTKGEAYIDDFEGVRNIFNLEIRRTAWHKSSAPPHKTQEQRGKLIWYNPYDRVAVKEIWPNKEVAAEESKTNVLVLELADTAGAGAEAWGGVMRYISSGYQDQSKSMFLEVWVRGNEGILYVDLGSIDEDIDGDGILDSEDKEINGYRDGILLTEEDIGLDGLADEDEPGYSSSNRDPNNDNWEWDSDNPDDYSKINGTENNREDPEGGNRPDTEDLSGNNYLDRYNNYYEFEIDLSSSEFEVPGTRAEIDGTDEYWRLYRIPIQDSTFTYNPDGKVHRRIEVGSPDWKKIKFARLWVDNIDGSGKVWIAQIELVGNKWEEDSKYLEVTAKNTHEDNDYVSPPGVTGERSVTTGIMSQEQSLVIIYDDVPGEDTISCHRTSFAGESMDLTLYNSLEMWVYFNEEVSDDSVIFFYRMGRDAYNMYEYRTSLKPGWDEQNVVRMDFAEMTAFKDQYLTSISDTSIDDLEPIYELESGGCYIIRGSPTLTDIRYFEMGVINPFPHRPISGEIWVDELKVTDVRKEPGWAEKTTFSINFADLANFNGSLERQDSEFHGLNQQVGSGATKTTGNLSCGFSPHKFAPQRWGLNLPITANYTRSISVPRLKTGSDISVPDSLRDDETTVIRQYSANITETLRPIEAHWLIGLTLARLSHSVSFGETNKRGPTNPVELSQNWSARQTYDLTPKAAWKVHLTRWAFDTETDTSKEQVIEGDIEVDTVEVPRLLDWELNLAPTALKFETSLSGRRDYRKDRYSTITESNTRTLDHTATFNTNLLPPVTTGFSLQLKRDIGDSAYFHWSHPIVIGTPVSKTISENIRYTPGWLKWLSQSYEATAQYTENTDPQTYQDRFGAVTVNRTYRISLGLRWRELGNLAAGTGSRPSRGGRGREGRPPRRGETEEEPDTTFEDEEPPEKGLLAEAMESAKPIFDRLDDVQLDWSRDERRSLPDLASRPRLAYQLALTTDPGVPSVEESTDTRYQIASRTINEKTTIRTGAKLPFDITTTLRYNYVTNEQIGTNNTKQNQLSFPDITANWNGLGKLFFFPKIASNVRTNAHYIHENKKNYEAGALKTEGINNDFNPLISLNMNLRIGVNTEYSSSWRDGKDYTYTAATTTVSHNAEITHKFTASYSIRGTKGFKIPLIGTLKFENQLSFSLSVQNAIRKAESWVAGNEEEVSVTRDDNEWSITPSASYQFSRNIHGGMELKWIDTRDNKTDKVHHVRDVSIWVELKF